GAPPRVNVTVDPSFEIDNCVDSMPLSFRNAVTRTGLKSGAAAVKTLRSPLSLATHAMRSVFLALASSSGNAKIMNCAIHGCADFAGGAPPARGRALTTATLTSRQTKVRFMAGAPEVSRCG